MTGQTASGREALVLVIEDERPISDLVRYNLERDGLRVACASDGEAGLARVFDLNPQVVVLDLMLPGLNGLEILREIRGHPSTADLPVLVLTARSAEMDKLLGFEHGADDYLTKPFSPRELVARVRALLRRGQPRASETRIAAGPLQIDLAAREASIAERKLSLTRREFELLAFLAGSPGRVVTRGELLAKVWGYDQIGETRTVDVHIRRLRSKLGDEEGCIETVTGVGYRFVPRSAG